MATKSDLLDSVVRLLAKAMSENNKPKRKKGYKRVGTRVSS